MMAGSVPAGEDVKYCYTLHLFPLFESRYLLNKTNKQTSFLNSLLDRLRIESKQRLVNSDLLLGL
jgi:hypothetical protein